MNFKTKPFLFEISTNVIIIICYIIIKRFEVSFNRNLYYSNNFSYFYNKLQYIKILVCWSWELDCFCVIYCIISSLSYYSNLINLLSI